MSAYESPTKHQVKGLRRVMGWTQYEVAKRLHLSSPTMVSRYERGQRTMHAAFWELLCIKAADQHYKVTKRREEIERHKNSVMYVNKLLRNVKED